MSKLTEIDFALAHEVLNDPAYAAFYAEQSKKGRRVILDNGMHEQGVPMTVPEILEAAHRINPWVVIPPDKLGDGTFTWHGFQEMKRHPRNSFKLALVLQGATRPERLQLFMDARQSTHCLMLPFREPRLTWFQELLDYIPKHTPWPPFLHLLGVNTLEELTVFDYATSQNGFASQRVSVDTGKPIKLAAEGELMSEASVLRGRGKLDLEKSLDIAQQRRAYFNIAFLRKYTG